MTAGVTVAGSNSVTIFRVEAGAVLNLFQVNLTQGRDVAGPGAMLVMGEANLTRCAVFNNQGSAGGGITNSDGVLRLTNCTVANNTSSSGAGGVLTSGTLELVHCTFSGNSTAGAGGGVRVFSGTASVRQCVVAGNSASEGQDVWMDSGGLTWAGQNIVQDVMQSAGTVEGPAPLDVAPMLAALGDYGGQALSMPPLPGSPAVDPAGGAATSTLGTDQRGYARVMDAGAQDGAVVDIGAVETVTVATSALDTSIMSLRGLVRASAPGQVITFAPELAGAVLTLFNGQIVLAKNVTVDGMALMPALRVDGG